MSKTLPSADGCKGVSSRSSRANGLTLITSQIASTHPLADVIGSWPKALLAFGFFALTNFVVFEDVLRHGATVTTDHLLSFAVLVGTFAAGHFFWPTWRAREFGTAAGLVMLFAAGTVYCVLTSAGRNAEALANKAAKVTEANGAYAELEGKARGASSDLTEAQTKLEAAEAEAKAATTKADDVCAKQGADNWRCERERTKADAAEGRKGKAEKARDDKKGASIMADAKLSVATKRDANGDLKYAAKILNYIPRVHATEESLADIVPFIKGVFCEFATLLFAAGAFGHRRGTVPQPMTVSTMPFHAVSGPSRDRPTATVLRLQPSHRALPTVRTGPQSQAAALVLLRQHLAVHGRIPQDDLAMLFGGPSKQTVSRWCGDWEADGHITRTASGRKKIVALSHARIAGRL